MAYLKNVVMSKIMEQIFRDSRTNKAYRLAMLEDYASVVSKIENIEPEKVKERIDKKVKEIFIELNR